ncbi:hypothetical protein ONE63_009633 [Megalurothrips usitatus]|uniref:Endocuticle structural glycoprotein SgAbd-2-like n=1 Tax=Megalurothrips usitatus TaxID=439358 RepID=A0AAV7XJY3_9NEOP|nr:hypothetical protein ONE63_009633 [Megalurothrips usitatus]
MLCLLQELVGLCLALSAALALQVPQQLPQQYRPYQNYQQQLPQYQQYLQRAVQAPILQYSNDLNPDGSFQYSYQTGDGISAQAAGYTRATAVRDADGNGEAQVVQGSYSYTGPDGVVYTVNYIADENGYRAQGAHLPTPPALPAPQQPFQYQQQPFQYRQQPFQYRQQPFQYRQQPFQRRY